MNPAEAQTIQNSLIINEEVQKIIDENKMTLGEL